jgi:hypothetical protein
MAIQSIQAKKDCRTYFDNGTLTFANRYSIREWSHTDTDKKLLFDNNKIFDAFVIEVNGSATSKHNNNNIIINGTATRTLKAVPIISYHNIDNNRINGSTTVDEFAKEMKYYMAMVQRSV